AGCTIRLSAGDRGVARSAGRLVFEDGAWWLHNDSSSSVLYVTGDRGFRVDLPPGMGAPVQQWHAKIRLQGLLGCYTLRLRLPDLDDVAGPDTGTGAGGGVLAGPTAEHLVTTTRDRPPLDDADRLVLAAPVRGYPARGPPAGAAPAAGQ